ncbi:sugar ABC transporter ATP-binding protein [Acidisoma cellulosilytica]|uniref:Sugar ABC transporter ATP-binding protein n=1 Tax=Acidisoma cellulosilyticum TaxID=2802395 RepID=A0A964E4X4_9PROT|nr:sugar ABC transporter ATP-binding protein [Acidisoma cellulosilyticum]MCB8881941.1 sugar ABC transporter ATP-binding protein [Acidisoma cellulosilyticum]
MSDLLTLTGITKSFGGVRALKGVDFSLRAGEVHALLGENGAGKSTLMRVVGGELQPEAGSITFEGRSLTLADPKAAADLGIAVIHQELALAPDLSVAENIFMRELPAAISWGKLNRRARDVLARMGFELDVRRRVGDLAVAQQQVVEIAKALSRDVKVIVFDEPTAVLSSRDAQRLHDIIAVLRDSGVGIVYISHRLEEVFKIADRMTIMKDGALVGVTSPQVSTIDDVIRMMVGRSLAALFPKAAHRSIGEEVLKVENLRRGIKVRGVSLSVRAGEIVGLGGLVGSGRTETARLIFGADAKESGEIRVHGKVVKINSPLDAVLAGIGLVPEDRKHHGAILDMSIRINTTMARLKPVVNALGFIRRQRERDTVMKLGQQLRLKSAGPEAPVSSLSGGNQQKVVLAKWFHAGGDVIILDEPTRGVDVGAKTEIYGLIEELAAAGRAILVISSEHQELFGLCDRVLVMAEGELRGMLLPEDYSEEKLLALAMTNSVAADQAAPLDLPAHKHQPVN